jgi:HK97 family phage portal protein
MRLPSLFRRAQRASIESPSQPITSAKVMEFFGLRQTSAGVLVTEDSAFRLATVYTCVKVIGETLGMLPLGVFEEDGTGSRRPILDHRLARTLRLAPNPYMTSPQLRECLAAHAALSGNAYVEIERRARDKSPYLYPLQPALVTPEFKAGRLNYRFQGTDKTPPRDIAAEDMIHVPGVTRDGIRGVSIITAASESIALAAAAQEFGARFFSNDARPGIVIEAPTQLTDEQVTRMKGQISDAHGALGKSHKAMILEEGWKIHEVGIPPEDAQFLETRKFQREEIAALFRVPPVFIGDHSKSTFSNNEQQGRHFATHCIAPWARKIEAQLEAKLFGEAEPTLRVAFNLDPLRIGDFKDRQEGLAQAILGGMMTPNEARALEGRPPLEGGDRLLFPLNMTDDPAALSAAPDAAPDAAPGADPGADPDPEESDNDD